MRTHLFAAALLCMAMSGHTVSTSEISSVAMSGHTVSGISSGGFMAVQHHVAFSNSVTGAGVVAGGPFFCAQAKLPIAITSCMTTPALISIPELVAITKTTALSGFIDNPIHLKDDAVWLFSGLKDTVVSTGVVQKLFEYYSSLNVKNIVMVNTVEAEHAMPTLNYGSACGFKGEPYINNCNFDGAGEILLHLYNTSTLTGTNHQGHLLPPTAANNSNIISFSQSQFNPKVLNWTVVGMEETGYAYVPDACSEYGRRLKKKNNTNLNKSNAAAAETATAAAVCRLHIAYHGCLQSHLAVGDKYVQHAGYNRWAEANGIVVVYPQAKKNILNPKGCWDWWGYTGPEYASNVGAQLATVRNIVRRYFDEEEFGHDRKIDIV